MSIGIETYLRRRAYCRAIATASEIEPVLENGHYSGFLGRIDETGSTLAPHFGFDNASSAFASAIEERTDGNDFEQIIQIVPSWVDHRSQMTEVALLCVLCLAKTMCH